MVYRIGIRREDSYRWERRVPLIPQDAKELAQKCGIEIIVQSSPKRAFTDAEYRQADISVANSLASCPVIFGIKEIPVPVLEEGKTYVLFSHTAKGQPDNMPMLKRILELGCTLIDYEKVTDENGRRLIFFGHHAGLAGMIDTLWALGKRLAWEGIANPFELIARTLDYPDLAAAKQAIRWVGKTIAEKGLPEAIVPLVIGIVGYGNVSRGAQEILDLLPAHKVAPKELPSLTTAKGPPQHVIYAVVFKEEDTVQPIDVGRPFNLQEYYAYPERYRSIFNRYLSTLTVLVNAIYWESIYPRLLTKQAVRQMVAEGQPCLRVIGDISCDVEGAIECTIRATEPDDPVYVYDPVADRATSGVAGNGPVIMAVEILPSELPREASTYFSGVLKAYVPAIARADFSGDFESCPLPAPIKRAVIAYRGKLAPAYRYLENHLEEDR